MNDMDRTKWMKTVVKSFRLNRDLLHQINEECRYRNLDFSSYVRHAAIIAMKRPPSHRKHPYRF